MSWVPDVRKTLGGSILFFHTLMWWTMLTMQEGGATTSAPKLAEDVGVNDLGDGGAVMRALRHS